MARKASAAVRQNAPEAVYTPEQVAEMAHLNVKRVYRLMREGVIGYVVPNGCKRPKLIPKSEYEKWIGLS